MGELGERKKKRKEEVQGFTRFAGVRRSQSLPPRGAFEHAEHDPSCELSSHSGLTCWEGAEELRTC